MFRFAILPMFLFSGTFFPVSQLPDWLEPVAVATPLFHAVELVRKLALPGRGRPGGLHHPDVGTPPVSIGDDGGGLAARHPLPAGEAAEVTAGTVTSAPGRVHTGSRAHRLLERNLLVYRRIWKVIFSGFFEPVFYLFSIGIGLGALVGDVTGPSG
jgi:hypothetical protein